MATLMQARPAENLKPGGTPPPGLPERMWDLERAVTELPGLAPAKRDELAQGFHEVREELREKIYEQDKWFYRIVVGTLGLSILFIVVAITVLILYDKKGFDALTAIGSAAVGGLVGLFVPSPLGTKKG